jgi:glyoxylate/hydroxypyruvate reductase A
LPIARLVDDNQTAGMRDYVLATVLKYHRRLDVYARQQADRVWNRLPHVDADQRRVGIMGLGALGIAVAKTLRSLDFDVAGWSRTPKDLRGVATYAGVEGWLPFLARSDILVCLLPLTPETRGILDRRTFAALPQGAAVINAGRGGHLIPADLIEALDSGQLGGATLDVFEHEPLKPEDPLWAHKLIDITPHIATISTPRTAAARIVENIRRARAGLPLLDLVDRTRGY